MCEVESSEINSATEAYEADFDESISEDITDISLFDDEEKKEEKIKLLGFRSGVKWKKIVSLVYLLLCNKFLMTEVFSVKNNYDGFWNFIVSKLDAVITFVFMISPYILLSKSPVKDKILRFINESKRANVYGIIIVCASFVLLTNAVDMMYIKDEATHSEKTVITLKDREDRRLNEDAFIETGYEEKAFEQWVSKDAVKAEIYSQITDEEVKDETSISEEVIEERALEEPDIISEVYVTPSGKKYHYSKACAGKNAYPINRSEAENNYGPCKKCAH